MSLSAAKRNGNLVFLNMNKLNQFLKKYKEDERFDVDIKQYREHLSDRQRRYYFGAIIKPAADHFKVDYTKLHKYFKSLFLLKLNEFKGEVVPDIISLSNPKFSTKDMANYTEHVRVELRSPDNIFKESFDTEDSEDYLARINEGIL